MVLIFVKHKKLNYLCTLYYSIALAGIDYVTVGQEIIFTKSSQTSVSLYIPLINDCDCVEVNEMFFVNISTDMDCVNLTVDYVTVTIIDDEGKLSLWSLIPL